MHFLLRKKLMRKYMMYIYNLVCMVRACKSRRSKK